MTAPPRLIPARLIHHFDFHPHNLDPGMQHECMKHVQYSLLHQKYVRALAQKAGTARDLEKGLIYGAKMILLDGEEGDQLRKEKEWCWRCHKSQQAERAYGV